MPGSKKLSYDFDVIEGELKKEGRFKKAVSQLITNIDRCLKKGLRLDNDYNVTDIKIYPIIVVHDSLYSSAALNYWIHYWSNDELQVLKNSIEVTAFDFNRIWPLTLIEIDSLIIYQNNFVNGELVLVDLIEAYHQFVQYNVSYENLPQDLIEEHSKKSVIPFSEFLRNYALKEGLTLNTNIIKEMLKDYGGKLNQEVSRRRRWSLMTC